MSAGKKFATALRYQPQEALVTLGDSCGIAKVRRSRKPSAFRTRRRKSSTEVVLRPSVLSRTYGSSDLLGGSGVSITISALSELCKFEHRVRFEQRLCVRASSKTPDEVAIELRSPEIQRRHAEKRFGAA